MGKKDAPKQQPSSGEHDNVTAIVRKCSFDSCRARDTRAGFCNEHFSWFKAGLLTKDGRKPRDFDKKYLAYQRRKAA